MATVSTGQITIVDLHDAPGLNAWISASLTTVQTYNNQTKTYTPNYASTAQVLTLNLTKAGGAGASLIGPEVTGVKWTKVIGNAGTEITSTINTDTNYKSGPSNSILTTKTNVPTDYNAVIWQVEGIYNDPATGLPINFNASIDLKLVQLAKAAVVALAMTPNGDFFRNKTPSSLRITADIYKDGSVSNGSRKFKWFAADSSITTSQDSDAGIGWRKITATSGTTGAVANTGFDTATTLQGVLTVYPGAVTNGQVFLMIATDNDGGTSGTKMKQYITLKDLDDPIMTVVESTGGNILKNGAGSTTLTARLFQNGEEVDAGATLYNYKWYKWQNNALVPNFGGTGIAFKSGKTLAVGASDVNNTTTFKVEVESK